MNYYLDTEFHEYVKAIATEDERGLIIHNIDTIELISIGITSENDRDYYAICKEFDITEAWNNEWLRKNVLLNIWTELEPNYTTLDISTKAIDGTHFTLERFTLLVHQFGKTKAKIAEEIVGYIGGSLVTLNGEVVSTKSITTPPKFHAYYADYDWVVFCWLFGRMTDLPKGFPMYCVDLKQEFDRLVIENPVKATLEESIAAIKTYKGYPKQENEHNALADAKWNKKLHKFITTL